MRYDDPNLLDSLAREYVIGTLYGRARRRFGRVLAASLVARRAVASWERQLTPLAASVRPVQPPAESWARIEAAIGVRKSRAPAVFGGAWAALAAAARARSGIVRLAVLHAAGDGASNRTYVAVVTDATTGPVWLMQAFEAARSLRVTTINPRPEPPGSSYEPGMPPNGGAQPVSLGLIPARQRAARPERGAARGARRYGDARGEREPAGGSPTGLPTGPVIFTAPLLRS